MKTLLQAINLTTAAFGNVVVMVVANAKLFEQVNPFQKGDSNERNLTLIRSMNFYTSNFRPMNSFYLEL